MAGYLIAEEGPLAGLIINLEEGTEWTLGRDPDEATIVLEDPQVSRKHVICTLTKEGFQLENLSSVNPCTQNGKVVTEAVLLREGDILQIGSTYFRFTEKNPIATQPPAPSMPEPAPAEEDELNSLHFDLPAPTRWMLKVISGPNAGAEFSLSPGASYILGRDPNGSDVVFHDLSVSRQHAKITVTAEETVSIEDLQTRNGVLVNGQLITEPTALSSQDLIALGTTSFLVIDQEQIHETITSAPLISAFKPQESAEEQAPAETTAQAIPLESKNWKDLIISTKHLIFAGTFIVLLLVIFSATFSLFKTETIKTEIPDDQDLLKESLKSFPSIQFSFNESTGKLFLIGHVLTSVEKQELSYQLSTMPFIRSVEDTVIVDELVWQNMNALFLSYPDWQTITVHSPSPGKFVLKGYVQTLEQAQQLSDYINNNFPYPTLLDNQVVIGNNLVLRIQSLLVEQGFSAVVFTLGNGELVLSGRIDDHRASDFDALIKQFQLLPGIRTIQNYVVYSAADTSRIDVSSQYNVTGFSKGSNKEQFVVINQKIFSVGDFLNGMQITDIQPNIILLEKDGIKFRINYNLQ